MNGHQGDIAAGVSRSWCIAEFWLVPIYIARRLSRMSHTHGDPFSRLCTLPFASSKEYKIVTRYTSTHGAGFIACDVRSILPILSLLHIYNIVIRSTQHKTLGWEKQ